jgi:hypothetical protein
VSLLVVGRRGIQNDHDHRSYVLETDSLHMQVCDEGGVRVGAGVDGAIAVIVLGDCDPLGIGELMSLGQQRAQHDRQDGGGERIDGPRGGVN